MGGSTSLDAIFHIFLATRSLAMHCIHFGTWTGGRRDTTKRMQAEPNPPLRSSPSDRQGIPQHQTGHEYCCGFPGRIGLAGAGLGEAETLQRHD